MVCGVMVSLLQNYDITTMSLVTGSVEPGTLVLAIWEQYQHGDIRPCGDARRSYMRRAHGQDRWLFCRDKNKSA